MFDPLRHSITSSAAMRMVGGTVRPIAARAQQERPHRRTAEQYESSPPSDAPLPP